MKTYLVARKNNPLIITQYLREDKHDIVIESHQILGPLDDLQQNEADYIFTLGDMPGIFVVSRNDAVLLPKKDLDELEELGL